MRKGQPLDAALDREVGVLSDADRRLAHELAAGVLRHQADLDAQLAPHVTRGWSRVTPPLRDLLRVGTYQLTALDRVPPHAAVSTSVTLARKIGGQRAGGFVNAVLRAVARETTERGNGGTAEGRSDSTWVSGARSRRSPVPSFPRSAPDWLVERWRERFGDEGTARLLEWNNTKPALVVQPARVSLEDLRSRWESAGVRFHPAPYGAGLVTDRGRPSALPGYAEGEFVVQDPAQALVTWYADLPPNATVYDACAAPGGKTVAVGRGVARVVAADASRARVGRLAENLRRAGHGTEHAVVADARTPPVTSIAAVLLDAPCLGTGTFARHPDARWRVSPDALERLVGRQAELLEGAASAVAPGGILVYATCSLEPEENEQQVDRFLDAHPEFHREPPEAFPPALMSSKGDLMILPHRHGMDGAFAARLRRAA